MKKNKPASLQPNPYKGWKEKNYTDAIEACENELEEIDRNLRWSEKSLSEANNERLISELEEDIENLESEKNDMHTELNILERARDEKYGKEI